MQHFLLAIAVGLAACGGAAAGDAGADGGLTPAEMACGRFLPTCESFYEGGGCTYFCNAPGIDVCADSAGIRRVTQLNTPENCGRCGRVCTAPAGRVATCNRGTTGSVCGDRAP